VSPRRARHSARSAVLTWSNSVIALTALALAGVSAISFRYFFPVPGVLTGVAAVLALLAVRRPSPGLPSVAARTTPP
jgi:hypothetical protein